MSNLDQAQLRKGNNMLGQINKFKVERITDLGYMISKDKVQYFMHKNDCNNVSYNIGDTVEAFIYKDKKNRLAATTNLPSITTNRYGFCEVNGVFATGVFINIGVEAKDLMLSKFDLPLNKNEWPQVGDKLPCIMVAKNDKLYAKLVTKSYFDLVEEKPELKTGSLVKAYIYRINNNGINLVDDDYNVFFVHSSNLEKKYRLGEEVEIKVSKKSENDYTSYLPHDKVDVIFKSAKVILDYLESHNGVMIFTSKSSPETIKRVFNMSKVQFKDALGRLYKERKIQLFDDKTVLIK